MSRPFDAKSAARANTSNAVSVPRRLRLSARCKHGRTFDRWRRADLWLIGWRIKRPRIQAVAARVRRPVLARPTAAA